MFYKLAQPNDSLSLILEACQLVATPVSTSQRITKATNTASEEASRSKAVFLEQQQQFVDLCHPLLGDLLRERVLANRSSTGGGGSVEVALADSLSPPPSLPSLDLDLSNEGLRRGFVGIMEYLLASVSTTNNNPSSSSSSSVSHDDPLFQICLEGLRKLPLLTRDSNNDLCPHLEVFFTEVTARLLRLATADAMDDDCKADLMAAFWDCANHCVDSIIQQDSTSSASANHSSATTSTSASSSVAVACLTGLLAASSYSPLHKCITSPPHPKCSEFIRKIMGNSFLSLLVTPLQISQIIGEKNVNDDTSPIVAANGNGNLAANTTFTSTASSVVSTSRLDVCNIACIMRTFDFVREIMCCWITTTTTTTTTTTSSTTSTEEESLVIEDATDGEKTFDQGVDTVTTTTTIPRSARVWDNLLDLSHFPAVILTEPQSKELTESFANLVYSLCWNVDWMQLLKAATFAYGDFETFDVTTSTMLEIMTLAVCIMPSLQHDMLAKLNGVLDDMSSLAMDNVHTQVYFSIFESMTILSGLSTHGQATVDAMTRFLIAPSPVFTELPPSDCASLRHCVSVCISNILKRSKNSSMTKSTLFSFINVAQSTSNANPSCSLIIPNALSCIACTAPNLKSKEIIETVFAVFARKLEDEDNRWDEIVWENLGNIALVTSDILVFQEVIGLLLEQSKKNYTMLSRVSKTLARVSGRPVEFRKLYLSKIMELLIEKATEAQAMLPQDTIGIIDEIKDITSILKYICDQIASEMDPTKLSAHLDDYFLPLFRNFWIFMVLVILPTSSSAVYSSSSTSWPKDWPQLLASIATASPALLLQHDKKHLEADILSNSVLSSIKISDQALAKIRSNLAVCIPSKAAEIRLLSPSLSVYLLSVYHLEMLRVKRKFNVDYVLQYLADDRNSDSLDFLECIVDEILKYHFLDKTKRQDILSIEHHLRCLVMNAGHRLSRVRLFCMKKIDQVISQYPQMLWNQNLVHLMLDILQYLDSNNLDGVGRKAMLLERTQLTLRYADPGEETAALEDYLSLCLRWLDEGLKACPKEIGGLFQSYTSARFVELFSFMSNDSSRVASLFRKFCSDTDFASSLVSALSRQGHYAGEIAGMSEVLKGAPSASISLSTSQRQLKEISANIKLNFKALRVHEKNDAFIPAFSTCMHRAAAVLLAQQQVDEELIQLVCQTPVVHFVPSVMQISVCIWSWVMSSKPSLSGRFLACMLSVFENTAKRTQGLYLKNQVKSPFMAKMTYAPSESQSKVVDASHAHLVWINFFHDRLNVMKYVGKMELSLFFKIYHVAHMNFKCARSSISARSTYFSLVCLGFKILELLEAKDDTRSSVLRYFVYDDALSWFSHSPMWGSIQHADLLQLKQIYLFVKRHNFVNNEIIDTQYYQNLWSGNLLGSRVELVDARSLLLLLLESEINRAQIWLSSLEIAPDVGYSYVHPSRWPTLIRVAWAIDPKLAVNISSRFVSAAEVFTQELSILVLRKPADVIDCPEAITYLTRNSTARIADDLRFLLFCTPISPIAAISLLGPSGNMHPWIIQYAVRVLEYFPVDQVFFYIPQMVQGLRYDSLGYIERFILETAKSSQLFAHQIIWNMNANMYKDGDGKVPDALKDTLERIIQKIIGSLSGSDKDFYEREFNFFKDVTGISGTLKAYIHKSKPEKKKKIDEEIRKIKVDVGVYLPSNPESIVVGIDYDSGRPLQSHAKAPFMATFKIKKAHEGFAKRMSLMDNSSISANDDSSSTGMWQSAIFKVGDDCRQDILALQLISIFKSIFEKAGLDMYLFPYRVVATNPGCGIIEVIPKSISRDMMGREKVNSLYEYFVSHYGSTNSMGYYQAQQAFVKSLAPYSLILYLLQIKDRHNGNIMFDSDGHIVHIDFGFILDISPGGINFESAPFKLTTEMIQVLGGDANSPAYRAFAEATVKAYLACRPYANEIISMVSLMADSSLPCFKGEPTLKKLRDRFQLDKSEKMAAEFMLARIRESHENTRSKLYDGFQFLQNGIPH